MTKEKEKEEKPKKKKNETTYMKNKRKVAEADKCFDKIVFDSNYKEKGSDVYEHEFNRLKQLFEYRASGGTIESIYGCDEAKQLFFIAEIYGVTC